MKKKMLLLSILVLGSLSLNAATPTVTDNATVEVTVFKAVTLTVDDIDFTKWMTGQTPGDSTSALTIAEGTASETMTLSTPNSLELSETGGAKLTATMDFEGDGTSSDDGTNAIHSITLDASGGYTGQLKASLGAIPTDQATGKYTGTTTITVTYN